MTYLGFNFRRRPEGWFYTEVGKSIIVLGSNQLALSKKMYVHLVMQSTVMLTELSFCLNFAGVFQDFCGGKCVNWALSATLYLADFKQVNVFIPQMFTECLSMCNKYSPYLKHCLIHLVHKLNEGVIFQLTLFF